MSPDIITARIAVPLRVPAAGIATPPARIMYLPGGEHEVSARLNGEPRTMKVRVDAATAAALQRDLTARLASGGPAPFFDLHHDNREAAAYPTEFSWEDGGGALAEGVYCKVTWTPAGTAAVTCAAGQMPAVRYFSPRAAYNAAQQRITGLLPAASGNAAGGLVSDPAFTEISPLTAGKAAAHAATDKPNNQTHNTMTTEMQALVAAGVLTAEEAATDNAAALIAARVSELKAAKAAASDKSADSAELAALKAKLDTAAAELLAMKERAADVFVASLQRDGKIPPQAKETAKMWRAQHLANAAAAEAAAGELTAAKAGSDALTDDEAAAVTAEKQGELVASKARQLRAANPALTWDQAWAAAETEIKSAN